MKYLYKSTPVKVNIRCTKTILKNICHRDNFLTRSMSALILFQTFGSNGQATKSNVLQHVLHFIPSHLSHWI